MKQVYVERQLVVRAKQAIDQLQRVGNANGVNEVIRDLMRAVYEGDRIDVGDLVFANCAITEPFLDDLFYPDPNPENIVIHRGAIGKVTDLMPGETRSVMVEFFYGIDTSEWVNGEPEGYLVSPSWINKIY